MRTTLQCILIIGIVLVIIFVFSANHLSFSQNSTVPSSPIPTETIKIVKPVTTQNVSSQDELIISGQSSDNNLKNCSVTVIVNDVKPYQNAVAKGSGGATDFSEWEFVLHNNYTHINAGENKITSKLLCASAPPRWYSVFVNGVPNSSNEDVFSPVQSEEQQNTPATNLSETNEIDGIQSEEQQNTPATNLSGTNEIDGIQSEEQQNTPATNLSETNEIDGIQSEEQQNTPATNLSETNEIDGIQSEEQQNTPATNLSGTNEIDGIQSEEQQNTPATNLSGTNEIDGIQSEEQQNTPATNLSGTNEIDGNNNELLVSISSLKNPVERGDTQNTTITVTDSGSKAIANAEIVGKLIYPGNNYEKDFSGITDSQGKFVYSWIIGKKGDVGALSIEVQVSSQGYPPSSATGSFDIVDNS